MYYNNYHNNNIYGTYGQYYLYNNNNNYRYTYGLAYQTNNNIYPISNNNTMIKHQTPIKYLKPLIIQSPSFDATNNYIAKTPTTSPIKKSLINDLNKVNYLSKSPEPYIRIYNKKNNFGNYNNYNNNESNLLINQGFNSIKKSNILPQNINYPQKQIKALTPEPNLRRRKKIKYKISKNKTKFNNYVTKTFIPLKQNEINDNYQLNNIGTKYLSSPYINYQKSPSIRKTEPINNNSKIINVPTNNYYYQINNYPTKYIINRINPNIINKNKDQHYQIKSNDINIRQNRFSKYSIISRGEPSDNFNSAEFISVNLIGEGSYGKIYCVQWIKNNKLYAMKKLDIKSLAELKEFQGKVKMVKELYKKTNHYGFVKIFGDKVVPLTGYNNIAYNYYIIMELGDRDWEKEIQIRLLHQRYYTEYELFQIVYQLVKTLSIMQMNKISHRDVKPQNVLIINGIYKLCDYGETRTIDGNGLVIQNVRGSQLFMSPILFYAYNHNISQVMHNSYKSDVFSLGMCILLASCLTGYALYDIRELLDINAISKIINNKLKQRYSSKLINLIIQMLQIDENLRMDFIQLETYILNLFKN